MLVSRIPGLPKNKAAMLVSVAMRPDRRGRYGIASVYGISAKTVAQWSRGIFGQPYLRAAK